METLKITYKNKDGMLRKQYFVDPDDFLTNYKLGFYNDIYDIRAEFEGVYCENLKPFKNPMMLFLYIKLCQKNNEYRNGMFVENAKRR